jgi:hypothetical protein
MEDKNNSDLINAIARTAYKTGKIVVERKELLFIGGIILGTTLSVLMPQATVAAGLIIKEKTLEKQSAGDFFAYLRTFGSTTSWLNYFKSGKSSPQFFYYKEKFSTISPILYVGIGTGIGCLLSKNFYCAKFEKGLINCLKENDLLLREVGEIIEVLNKSLDSLDTPF